MENKYYTPDISEFYVGFEYEHEELMKSDDNPNDKNGKHWSNATIKTICADNSVPYDYTSLECVSKLDTVFVRNTFRVKYLDKEDIESFGFINIKNYYNSLNFQNIVNDFLFYEIDYDVESNKLTIERYELAGNDASNNDYSCFTLFSGVIKNKSELKQVLKMIGYKCSI